ncbi:hypothetical protein U6B65_12095 [Oscillospiraceae bacterium MB08-C2-2]|nr:hypothetical protein U6B65_12095 [Oscillospiraceae bacterium MB08-C2-2]
MLKKVTIISAITAAVSLLICLVLAPFVAKQVSDGFFTMTNEYVQFSTKLEQKLENTQTLNISGGDYFYELYRSPDDTLRVESNRLSTGETYAEVSTNDSTTFLNLYQKGNDSLSYTVRKRIMKEMRREWFEDIPFSTVRVYVPAGITEINFQSRTWGVEPHGDINWAMIKGSAIDSGNLYLGERYRYWSDDWEDRWEQEWESTWDEAWDEAWDQDWVDALEKNVTDKTLDITSDALYSVFSQMTANVEQTDKLIMLNDRYFEVIESFESRSVSHDTARGQMETIAKETNILFNQIVKDNERNIGRPFNRNSMGNIKGFVAAIYDHNLGLAGLRQIEEDMSKGSIDQGEYNRLEKKYKDELLSKQQYELVYSAWEKGVVQALEDSFGISLPMLYIVKLS